MPRIYAANQNISPFPNGTLGLNYQCSDPTNYAGFVQLPAGVSAQADRATAVINDAVENVNAANPGLNITAADVIYIE